jgi:glucan phosphoethanolaminetransferase (alkaline phosphatase superfamily)
MVFALYSKNEKLKHFSMILFIALSLLTVVVYNSGLKAKGIVKGMESIVEENIEKHEEFADISFIAIEISGVITFLILAHYRFSKPVPNFISIVFLFLLLIILAMMIYTSHLGGKISHLEIMTK